MGTRGQCLATMTPEGEGTRLRKRSVVVAGHATSISLETVFWDGLKTLARARGLALAALVAEIDAGRGGANLSSAIRVYVFERLARGQ